MSILKQLDYILQHDCQTDFNEPMLVGVSGGPDSLCLLDCLCKLGYPLVVAHLNHNLRKESTEDASIVKEAATARGLPHVIEDADVFTYSQLHKVSIEEAARIVRYEFLFRQAEQIQAQAVVVAHTADDQVETILMHMLRGTGLSGLRGMVYRMLPNTWSDRIPIVRPFLGVSRQEILAYCSEFQLHPVIDRTNADTTYLRNRIRHDLIPNLETYNPNIKSQLWRMSQTLVGDEQVLAQVTEDAWKQCCVDQSEDYIAVVTHELLSQPVGIQRRLVRKGISILRPGLRNIDFSMIERTIAFTQQPSRSGQMDLAVGLGLRIENDRLWIANIDSKLPGKDYPHLASNSLFEFTAPGNLDLPSGWHIQSEIVDGVQAALRLVKKNTDPYQAWIDIHGNRPVFQVRPPTPGDRFQPLGMDGHSLKLSDFFVNVKLLRRFRSTWPLICLTGDIVWVPGYRVAHPFRLSADTKQVIYMRLLKD